MPSELKIVKKKDCDGNIYYTAYLGNQIGGGATRNEAREELYKNIKMYIEYLEDECRKSDNAICPKFKIGQEVWYVYNKHQRMPFRCVIDKIVYDSSKNYKFRYDTSDEFYICVKEDDLFDNKQEAEKRLLELQG